MKMLFKNAIISLADGPKNRLLNIDCVRCLRSG